MKRRPKLLPMLGLLAAVTGTALWAFGGSGALLGSEEPEAMRGAQVRRGALRINVIQRGNLEAKDSVVLRSEVEGRSTILYLIPEGSEVQPGDLVAELDASSIEDRRVSQEITVENTRAALTKAEQNLQIQKSQNASDVAKSEQSLEFARSDLKKYEEGDWPRQLQEAEEAIVLAREELAQSRDRLEWSKRLEKDGFLTRTELEKDELANQRNQILLEQAIRKKKLLEDFDHPKQLAVLKAGVLEAERELDRVRLQADARLVDYKAAVSTTRSRLALEEEKLDKWVRQIQQAKIISPVAGMVVYGRTEGGYGRGGDPIQEGTEVRERQEIVTIPQAQGMIVEASLHESVLKKVHEGQYCEIRVDALPGQSFDGTVRFVAHLPDKGSWWANPNQRLYRTEITVDGGSPEMRPGMSCEVEIVVAEFEDTIYAPVQAILFHRGRPICFVDDGGEAEERAVEVGESSEAWAQILSGLEEGEIVLLSPPPGFVPEPGAAEPELRPGRSHGTPAAQASGSEGPPATESPSGHGAPAAGDWSAQWQKMDAEARQKAMERFQKMPPEEREKALRRLRGQGGAGAGSGQAGQ